ncbi:diaminopimelate decarboxylase [Parachryseolinea silvisoli]|jgi:diaminopimelate decarboxylase|uniref:diaminopimelate decarboxylase n=1 Tax=Parachryseolinea silvisoli TaxID=2873601 RepID=UPI00226581DF|nr:diaminopimelate decarboxylase [Parachryseolinea silvisoli]MCD9016418.1 diaminopimelate decarboxylase [Parachryseolinea silvisoli]
MERSHDTYTLQGVPVLSLAEQFGTPLYVYDAAIIVRQIKRLKDAYAAADVRLKYAAKALTNVSILKLMNKHGVGLEAVSLGEVFLARQAGYTPAEITFTPSGVDFSEIEEGVAQGVAINIDNLSTLRKFGEKYKGNYPCGIRLNPNIMAGGNIKISTGHSNSKFGISVLQLSEIQALIKEHNIRIRGLHIHTGSDIKETEAFLKTAEVLFETAKHFSGLEFIDFGSGFKVAYKDGDVVTNVEDLGARLTKAFNEFCTQYGHKLELWLEPGKFLVSESGTLLTHVNVVKPTPTVTFVGVNSGLNHLIRPMMYDAYHHIVNVSNPTGQEAVYTVVGYICETDTFGSDRPLNEVREGDVLAFKNAGAYGFSMASNYNSRPRPAEVLIVDGQPKLIRAREQQDDLLKNQVIIDL